MKRAISGVLALSILTVSFGQVAAEIIHLKTAQRIIGEMTPQEYQAYLLEQYIDQQNELNESVRSIRNVMLVYLAIGITFIVIGGVVIAIE